MNVLNLQNQVLRVEVFDEDIGQDDFMGSNGKVQQLIADSIKDC